MLQTAPQAHTFADFVLHTRYDDIPGEALERVQDLILDLIGVGAAATNIDAARIGREMALRLFNAGSDDARARILFDGRSASLGGAAYAGATQIDSLDAHDGYSPSKGHAGCGLLPGVLAFAEHQPELSGRDFLATMVLGYEIACRAGVALHGTVPDYHTSGAWVAVAVAALGVRLAGGDADTLRQAIGIAEYHGPRSQ
ncbi:MAG: MmgE/PrpD family protein, partial [Rhizobiales bacterium]|nr:MmgE/PrpD family protein [Hyphomicrobiales bacterium]